MEANCYNGDEKLNLNDWLSIKKGSYLQIICPIFQKPYCERRERRIYL